MSSSGWPSRSNRPRPAAWPAGSGSRTSPPRQHSTNITASTVNEAGKLPNLAVEEVQHLARRDHDCGIVVTRTGAGQFTVELSEHVPYVKVCTFLTSELAESNVATTVDS
jgi:hypothetical protein